MDRNNLTKEDIQKIRRAMLKEISESPPTIGLVGVSGVGKSSTINTMFKTNLPTSDTVACTKLFSKTDIELHFLKGQGAGLEVRLRIVDAPGLGEDIRHDPEYLAMYKEHLGCCDVILWIMTARNRAVALDQGYLKQFRDYFDRMVFCINQVDLVEPLDWNEKLNLPSETMLRNIEEIATDRKEKIGHVVRRRIEMVPYTAKRGYNLEKLFASVIESLPERRRWLYDALKNFSYKDFIPSHVRDTLNL